MVFSFLIFIVFIAEIVITSAIILHLCKIDKNLIKYNLLISDVQPALKDIMITSRKLSEQLLELAPIIVNSVKSAVMNLITNQLKNFAGALTFLLVKKEIEKHAE